MDNIKTEIHLKMLNSTAQPTFKITISNNYFGWMFDLSQTGHVKDILKDRLIVGIKNVNEVDHYVEKDVIILVLKDEDTDKEKKREILEKLIDSFITRNKIFTMYLVNFINTNNNGNDI